MLKIEAPSGQVDALFTTATATPDGHKLPTLHVKLLFLIDYPLVEATVAQSAAIRLAFQVRSFERNDVGHTAYTLKLSVFFAYYKD